MVQRICNLLITVILVFILSIVALLGLPRVMGNQVFAVLTASMEPTYSVGSIVIVKPVDAAEIQPGDAMTFESASFNSMVTHRVMEVDEENRWFITKGDNNNNVDFAPVSFDDVVGKVVFSAPKLGELSTKLKTATGIITAAALLVVILLLFIIPEIFKKEPQQPTQT